MGLDVFSICFVIFLLSFIYTLYIALVFNRNFNEFARNFHNSMIFHKRLDFNGPKFKWNHYFTAIFIANISISLAQFATFHPIEGVRYFLFFVHYPIFVVWIIEHIMILRGEAFIESLRVPWET